MNPSPTPPSAAPQQPHGQMWLTVRERAKEARHGTASRRWAVRLTFGRVAGAAVFVWSADVGGRGAESAAGCGLERSANGQNLERPKFFAVVTARRLPLLASREPGIVSQPRQNGIMELPRSLHVTFPEREGGSVYLQNGSELWLGES